MTLSHEMPVSERLHEVFISYARADGAKIAERLDKSLRDAGYSTWRDIRSIDPFQDFSAEIEVGIRDARFVAVCITPSLDRNPDSFVRREVLYAQQRTKPIIPLVFPNSYVPTLVNHLTWIPFYSGKMPDQRLAFHQGFAELISRLKRGPGTSTLHETADGFHAYLTELYSQIVNYLERTVSSFIPLQVEEKPEAVASPDTPRARSLPMAFWEVLDENATDDTPKPGAKHDRFEEAFARFGCRALLLGDPGSGKTTTLFAYAREATARRLENPSEPTPFLMPVATWDAKTNPTLLSWLTAHITALDGEQVKRVLSSGKALLLFDGLDELGSRRSDPETDKLCDPRVEFMKLVPPNNQVLVTCRVKEYTDIGERLRLNGAFRLLPLRNEQVRDYLSQQPDLWETIRQDEALREIVQTPLLLNLFVFAFAGLEPHLPRSRDLRKSPGALRAAVIRSYISRRYEHESRKRRIRRSAREASFSLTFLYDVFGDLAMDSWHWSFNYRKLERAVGEKGAKPFVEFAMDLKLILPVDGKSFRFIHPLVQEHFQLEAALADLDSKDPDTRTDAAFNIEHLALDEKADERAIPALVRAFKSRNPKLKHYAAFALAFLGDARPMEYLISRNPRANRQLEDNTLVPTALRRIGSTLAVAAAEKWQRQYDEYETERWIEWEKNADYEGHYE
jgi:hypothetical protein